MGSKKQKKRLECLKARKQKALKREDIFKSLSEHQLAPEQLLQYKSSTSLGQVEKKRKIGENNVHEAENLSTEKNFKGKKKKRKHIDDIDISEGIPLIKKVEEEEDSESEDDSDKSSDDYDNEDAADANNESKEEEKHQDAISVDGCGDASKDFTKTETDQPNSQTSSELLDDHVGGKTCTNSDIEKDRE